jgi:hypothetical protein
LWWASGFATTTAATQASATAEPVTSEREPVATSASTQMTALIPTATTPIPGRCASASLVKLTAPVMRPMWGSCRTLSGSAGA